MIEVEIKCRAADLPALAERLYAEGFSFVRERSESDAYYDREGEIRASDQALRLRSVYEEGKASRHYLTFKGKKVDERSMTRKELESEIGDRQTLHEILLSLGYHPIGPEVRKRRRFLCRGQVNACLDEVENLGSFLELEILTESMEGQKKALSEIEEILLRLGLSLSDCTRTSYLSALLQKEGPLQPS